MSFQVGDFVTINDDDIYSITTRGSIGQVIGTLHEEWSGAEAYNVQFYYVTSNQTHRGANPDGTIPSNVRHLFVFAIDTGSLQLIDPVYIPEKVYKEAILRKPEEPSKIIRKIRQLEERFLIKTIRT